MPFRVCLPGSALFLALAGCSQQVSPPATVPVSGHVMLHGKPAAGVRITMHPQFSMGRITWGVVGESDLGGGFTVGTGRPGSGAPRGDYIVTFTKPRIISDPEDATASKRKSTILKGSTAIRKKAIGRRLSTGARTTWGRSNWIDAGQLHGASRTTDFPAPVKAVSVFERDREVVQDATPFCALHVPLGGCAPLRDGLRRQFSDQGLSGRRQVDDRGQAGGGSQSGLPCDRSTHRFPPRRNHGIGRILSINDVRTRRRQSCEASTL